MFSSTKIFNPQIDQWQNRPSMQLHGDLEQWPHIKELVLIHKADWVKDESKYGHYESVPHPSFEQPTFEGPDTDIETGKMIFMGVLQASSALRAE